MPLTNEVRIEKTNLNGKVSATVTTTINGTVAVKQIQGTEAEVQAQIDALK